MAAKINEKAMWKKGEQRYETKCLRAHISAFWAASGTAWGAPGAPQDRLRAKFGVALGCPRTVPSASGCVPETALGVQNGPRSICRRFLVALEWICVNFRTSFRRFSLEPRATKAQKQILSRISKGSCVILTARLGSCVVQSLRTARTSFELMFEHCMFSFFS